MNKSGSASNRTSVKMSTLTLLAILPMLIVAQSCNGPEAAPCGCPARKTFDAQWLQEFHPDVAAEYASATIQAPTVTYGSNGDCTEIAAECPTGFLMANFNLTTSKITFDPKNWPNPTVVTETICVDGEWFLTGVPQPVTSNILIDTLGCIKQ